MTALIEPALHRWGLDGGSVSLIAARENQVYRVDKDGRSFAVRLHRKGYRTDAEIHSELDWMAALSAGGLSVPCPMASTNFSFLELVEDHQFDVLSWLPGKPLGAAGQSLKVKNRSDFFCRLGRQVAQMHRICDSWQPSASFTRPCWDMAGLVGERPLWDRFWDNPSLSQDERSIMEKVREHGRQVLSYHRKNLDYGLIHADLVRENIMLEGEQIHFIDFDDGGFGFRLFELATILRPNLSEPDYPALKAALIDGYRSVRPVDLALLDLFLLLRCATYVGWNISRMDENGAKERNRRFIDLTLAQAANVLD